MNLQAKNHEFLQKNVSLFIYIYIYRDIYRERERLMQQRSNEMITLLYISVDVLSMNIYSTQKP